jgi:hypothetical protein
VLPQLSVNKAKKPWTTEQPDSHVHHANVFVSLLWVMDSQKVES